MNLKALWLASVFSLFFTHGFAQKRENIRFENLTIQQGLSQSSVFDIHQDRLGYLWVGTMDGVDRYDGYTFKKYTHFLDDSTTLARGWVMSLTEKKNGDMILGTSLGNISWLNKKTGKFQNFENKSREILKKKLKVAILPSAYGAVLSLHLESNQKILWCATNGLGLLRVDLSTGEQRAMAPLTLIRNAKLELADQVIFSISPLDDRTLLLSTGNGLKVFDIRTEKIVFQSLRTNQPAEQNTCFDAISVGQGRYWLGTQQGIFELKKVANTYQVNKVQLPGLDLSKVTIPSLMLDKKSGEVWFSAIGVGIYVYQFANQQWKLLTNTNEIRLDKCRFDRILQDKNGVIWIGTDTYGLLSYDPGKNKFGLYAKEATKNVGLGFYSTWGGYIDKDQNLWIGNADAGQNSVAFIDRKTNQKTLVPVMRGEADVNPLYHIRGDLHGNIWLYVNTKEGRKLFIKKPKDKSFTLFKIPIPDSVYMKKYLGSLSHYLTRSGDLIKGGYRVQWLSDANGKPIFRDYAEKISQMPDSVRVFSRDTDYTYLFSLNHLYRWNERSNEIQRITQKPMGLGGKTVVSSFTVHEGRYFYFPTYGSGILKYDIKTQKISYLNQRNGLMTSSFYDIYKDKAGFMWLGSNYGIVRLNPKTDDLRIFTPSDGVQGFEFNANSSFQNDLGEIIFSGVNGVSVFNPEDIRDNSLAPRILIQSLKTNKQNWILDDDQLDSQIVLNADEKVVSFDFIALNFRNATQNRYAYRLVGYDKDWVYCGDRRFTTYTNLPAGEYVFQVKGSNNDGVWNEQGASIRIKVLPPWYLTWWAFGLYILMVGFAIRYLVVYREHIQRKKMEERRKNSELKAAQDLQKSMLPKEYPKRKDLAIHAFIRASTEVGGDYYDFFEQEDGTLFVVCGDATGHGTTSGMMVSITKAGLNGIEPKMPNLILGQLNKVIKRVDLGVLRMSLNIAKFDSDHMYLASAAMPPMYHFVAKTGLVEEIQQINLPLGGLKNETFDLITRPFEEGDVLVQLSDGIPEAPNLGGEMFDYEALAALIQQHGHASIQDLHAAIMEAVDAWLGGQHNPDDITLVITKKQ